MMKNTAIKDMALSLAKAEEETEVISILKSAGFWNDDKAWRYYGDDPMNYSTIGNQQSSADSALVEKLVNSVDAVLMRECLKRGIKPDSRNAPQSIAAAQKDFFNIYNGKLSNIGPRQRAKLAKNIFLVATGTRSMPSYSIIDKGEGQTPKRMPDTILSLTKNNKISISFVQGKFGMGGSGVLRFCSPAEDNNLQLVISKRSPEIQENDETKDFWGVTVIKRVNPESREKNSYYKYLAPERKILSFTAEKLPLLPRRNQKTFDESLEDESLEDESLEFGTYIKLYQYNIGKLKTSIVFDLYYRLSFLMPDVALPIRLVECRNYKGHSFETTLAGLSVRLDEDRSDNIEPEFGRPSTGEMTADGQKLYYSIHVFKAGKKKNYAGRDGVIFSINGQNHGALSKTFFDRKAVGMSYLSDSILVTINCSEISRRQQEKLFMPSRDRLAESDIRNSIERELTIIIRNHAGLKALRNKRRKEAIESGLKDSKPLADALESIIKKSPTLSSFLLHGNRIINPFNMINVAESDKFTGNKFPTYFDLSKKNACTETNPKSCEIGRRFRIQYETDAENDYLDRDQDAGSLTLKQRGSDDEISDCSLNLWNGTATLSISLPPGSEIGNVLCFQTVVTDASRSEPFSSQFYVKVTNKRESPGGEGGERKKPSSEDEGKGQKTPSKLNIPQVKEIWRRNWKEDKYIDFKFNERSALKVKDADGSGKYDFYINMDNVCLITEMKGNINTDDEILKARYKFGMILLGMSIINFKKNQKKDENETYYSDEKDFSVDDLISEFTEAISPVLLPVISSLGSMELET